MKRFLFLCLVVMVLTSCKKEKNPSSFLTPITGNYNVMEYVWQFHSKDSIPEYTLANQASKTLTISAYGDSDLITLGDTLAYHSTFGNKMLFFYLHNTSQYSIELSYLSYNDSISIYLGPIGSAAPGSYTLYAGKK